MNNPQDLTGRDLDLAVAKALGLVWWESPRSVVCLDRSERPSEHYAMIDEPGPEWDSPWLPGYDCDGDRIPELFAEIAARTDGAVELIRQEHLLFTANIRALTATGSTPNEALARLLLLVAER